MNHRYVSEKARIFNWKFREYQSYITEKHLSMGRNTEKVLREATLQSIGEIDGFLRDPSVRGHQNPKFLTPEVNEGSSFKDLLQRLRRQVHAACILADVTHLGPEANAIEAETLLVVEQEQDRLYTVISELL